MMETVNEKQNVAKFCQTSTKEIQIPTLEELESHEDDENNKRDDTNNPKKPSSSNSKPGKGHRDNEDPIPVSSADALRMYYTKSLRDDARLQAELNEKKIHWFDQSMNCL